MQNHINVCIFNDFIIVMYVLSLIFPSAGILFFCLIWLVHHSQGEGRTPIEPSGGKINDICVFKDSGLVLLALDSSQIPAYFIPDLGPSPKWCAPMENMTVCCKYSILLLILSFVHFIWNLELECLFFSILFDRKS